MQVCESREEFERARSTLKVTPCPHCKAVGCLIRHGFLRGYDEQHRRHKAVRAWRVFCSNRKRAAGCGRTFSIWDAGKVRRLMLTAGGLWSFLKQAVATGNKLQAFRRLDSGLSDSAPYRIWKRFEQAQAAIRTALCGLCPPPHIGDGQAEELTLAHLEAARGGRACPIAAFQAQLQRRFM